MDTSTFLQNVWVQVGLAALTFIGALPVMTRFVGLITATVQSGIGNVRRTYRRNLATTVSRSYQSAHYLAAWNGRAISFLIRQSWLATLYGLLTIATVGIAKNNRFDIDVAFYWWIFSFLNLGLFFIMTCWLALDGLRMSRVNMMVMHRLERRPG